MWPIPTSRSAEAGPAPHAQHFFNTMITGVFLIVYTTFEGEAYRYIIVFVHFGYTSGAAQGGGGSFKDRTGHYRRGELLWCMDGRANPLMDRKVVGAVLFGAVAMVAVVTSLTTPGCSVV